MEFITENRYDVLLSKELIEYENTKFSLEEFLFQEISKQLKLPIMKMVHQGSKAYEEVLLPFVCLDDILFKQVEYNKIMNPNFLFRYSLLISFLNMELEFDKIFIIPTKKMHFQFSNRALKREELNNDLFEINDILIYFKKHMASKEIRNEIDVFFALMDEKYNSKLVQLMSQFQINHGTSVNKGALADSIMNKERVNNFRNNVLNFFNV